MKKSIVILAASTILLTSCGTYAGAGAGYGAYYGGWIGSAIGGLAGGHRGHDIGTLIGMAGGAAVGAAIGSAADDQRQDDLYQYQQEKARLAANRKARQQQSSNSCKATIPEDFDYEQGALSDSGFDSNNSGDDRIDLDLGDDVSSMPSVSANSLVESIGGAPVIEIRNARFVDNNNDNTISRGESCAIIFEIYNSGTASAYDIQPTVLETTGNKHITISPSILIESLGAGKGVRYTARIIADNNLKNTPAEFRVAIIQGEKTLSKVLTFSVPCKKY